MECEYVWLRFSDGVFRQWCGEHNHIITGGDRTVQSSSERQEMFSAFVREFDQPKHKVFRYRVWKELLKVNDGSSW